jgi:ubiquinone biosynthesis protein
VRRPGVVEQVEEDLEILQSLAATASRRWEVVEDHDVVGLMQEFAETLRAELDYIREGRSAERFAKNFAGDPDVHIPEVFWETSTSRVLTLERIRGIKISDVEALEEAGIDRREDPLRRSAIRSSGHLTATRLVRASTSRTNRGRASQE